MQESRSCVVSVAGFDPSAGAGVLSDIKTFESHQVYGLGVCSALTVQNDIHFKSVEWVSLQGIQKQIDLLFERFSIQWIKIGIIENLDLLFQLVEHLFKKNNQIKIIWDPILMASAGFQFHTYIDKQLLVELCKRMYLITPNFEEIKKMLPGEYEVEAAKILNQHCAVLLKGGHRKDEKKATDTLFVNNTIYEFKGEYNEAYKKHGSGCVFSSAILSALSKGNSLPEACENAKTYIAKFLKSNQSLLGYHS